MSRSPRAAVLLSIALLTGCATRSVPVDRKPDPSLLQPCARPQPPPAKATDNDIAFALVDAVQRYLECEARQAALVKFIKGEK